LKGQMIYLKKRGYFYTKLKTRTSERYIIVDDYLLEELRRWREQQIVNEKELGGAYICVYKCNDGSIRRAAKGFPVADAERITLICTNLKGAYVPKEVLVTQLKKVGVNTHSFRHTHATQLIENGAQAKAVASRLGHSNVLITQNLYTHNTLKLQEEATSIFTKILQTNF